MPYKWNPGHYIMATPNTDIDDVLPAIANIPNILGVQVRLEWKKLETAYNTYTATPVLDLLAKCQAQAVPAGQPKKRLIILLTYKSFSESSFATPGYINTMEEAKVDDGAPLYRGPGATENPVFGNYDYGTGWHPKFYNPWIRDRFIKLFQALGPLLDSQPLLEAIYLNETAYGGVQVPINGMDWDNPDGLQRFRERSTAHANALWATMLAAKAAFPTTVFGQYVNFPNTGKFSIIKNPTNPSTTPGWPANTALPPKMALNGLCLGGPDSWLGEESADNGPFQMYKAYKGIIPLAPSVQSANYSHLNHADQKANVITSSITIQQLYYKATTHPNNSDTNTTNDVVTLYGNHVVWTAANWAVTGHPKTSWEEVRDFFKAKWEAGPDAGNRSPGVATAVPSAIVGGPGSEPPVAPTLKLVVDSGVSSTDNITNNGNVVADGVVSGGSVEYSTNTNGPWSATKPALKQGTQTWFARQFNSSGMVSPVSAAFTFQFCNTVPALRYITVRDLYALIGFTHPINLTNDPRPLKSAYVVKVNGVVKATTTGTFVNEDQQRVKLDWTGALTGGETVTISYTQPTDATKLQDIAGNFVASFGDTAAINLVGAPELTTSCAITSVAGRSSGGLTNDTTPLVVGTLSAAILPSMVVEVQRQKNDGAFLRLGYANVTGTDWTWQEPDELDDATYTYRARVQHGDVNSTAGFSALFSITVGTDLPSAPTIVSVEVTSGTAFTLTGTWVNRPGHVLTVGIAGVGSYAVGTGLIVVGNTWSVSVPPLAAGNYNVGASVTDAAGNTAFNETPAQIMVTGAYNAAQVILRFCVRRPI